MWWDDDPKATGFGVRSVCGRRQILLRRLSHRRAPAPDHHRPVSRAGPPTRRAGAGEGTAQADRPGPRPRRHQARAPRSADRSRPDRPLHRRTTCRKKSADKVRASTTRSGCSPRSASISASTPRSPTCTAATSGEMHRKISEFDRPRRQAPAGAGESHPDGLLEDVLALVGAEGRGDAALAQRRPRQSLQGHRAQPRGRARAIFQPSGAGSDQRRPGRVSPASPPTACA